ncbi:hypothetical protein [Blautia marasmi]|uniref:hypothetical protein n=1 Tax=Blautia marasmi TaxID=1917868 RepID=UPI00131A23AE|nr:hypothetical protein [Blautia marasmi]
MEGISTSLVTGITSIATEAGSAIASIVPVALPIVGMVLIVTIGLKVFKRITNK